MNKGTKKMTKEERRRAAYDMKYETQNLRKIFKLVFDKSYDHRNLLEVEFDGLKYWQGIKNCLKKYDNIPVIYKKYDNIPVSYKNKKLYKEIMSMEEYRIDGYGEKKIVDTAKMKT